jgi:predicted AlkP superfamily pyrophosphatase or phosphodiesterase
MWWWWRWCAVTPEAPQTIVLVSLDGFRWDYLDRPEASGLRAIAASGVHARQMEPTFPTVTFPNHYTIVTGLWAEHHGIVGNTMVDAKLGRFTISDTNAVRTSGWWGGEPLWVTAEKQGRRSAAMFWPGSEAEIAGVRPTWAERYDDQLPYDRRIGKVLSWLALPRDSAPALITTYFSAVDAVSHRAGPDAPESRAAHRPGGQRGHRPLARDPGESECGERQHDRGVRSRHGRDELLTENRAG